MSQTRKSKGKVYNMHVRFVVAEDNNQRRSTESTSFYESYSTLANLRYIYKLKL